MVSNAAQLILDEAVAKGCNLHDLADYAVVQINDTHPSMIIPEFIRLLTAKGIDFEEASDIVAKVCAYTNHTILAEALEKWPMSYLEEVVPHLVPIIKQLDEKVRENILRNPLRSLTATTWCIWHIWISTMAIPSMVWQHFTQRSLRTAS